MVNTMMDALNPTEAAPIASRRWLIAILLILAWLAVTRDRDMVSANFFIIPLFLSLLVFFLPIKPRWAAGIDIGLSAANVLTGLWGATEHGSGAYPFELNLVQILFLTFAGAAIVWLISLISLHRRRRSEPTLAPATEAQSPDLVFDLATLADLKDRGAISEEEFANAKQRLLDGR
jgi:hypothetical protein